MEQAIQQLINDGILKLQDDNVWSEFIIPEVIVERPKDRSHGDWTTNIAFMLTKELKKTPLDIAKELVEVLNESDMSQFSSVEAMQPGYINFVLNRNIFVQELKKIIDEGDKYGSNNQLKNKKITIEYTQPNPFKPFHIGHLMSNTIGEALSRIIEFSGADITRANYQGDVGPHVAKALWGLKKLGFEPNDIDKIGEAYAYGHTASKTDKKAKEEIKKINEEIYAKNNSELMKIYEIGRTKTLEHFEKIYEILGTKFDEYYFESEVWQRGKNIVREYIGDVFEESDGAIIFDGEKYGLHKRVFITAQGLPTYEAKELGLAMLKRERNPSDLYVVTTAVEQEEYFKVVQKVLELIEPSFKNKIKHISHGMMQLASGKMSSRSGNVITGESLIKNAQAVATKKMSKRAYDSATKDTINAIAVAGIKFSILKQHTGKNIVYDVNEALSFDGDSGPYLQYTYARCQSVIMKAKENNIDISFKNECEYSKDLEKILAQFGDIVKRSEKEYAPHYIANYLLELAHTFNSYYANNTIIDINKLERSAYRNTITIAVAQVIKNGTSLLGIKVPQQM